MLYIWNRIRYRKWVVFDPFDMFVLYIGSYRNCVKVVKENYGGLTIIPLKASQISDGGGKL